MTEGDNLRSSPSANKLNKKKVMVSEIGGDSHENSESEEEEDEDASVLLNQITTNIENLKIIVRNGAPKSTKGLNSHKHRKGKGWGSNMDVNSYVSQRSASIANTENNEPLFLQSNNLLSAGNNPNLFSNSSRTMSD